MQQNLPSELIVAQLVKKVYEIRRIITMVSRAMNPFHIRTFYSFSNILVLFSHLSSSFSIYFFHHVLRLKLWTYFSLFFTIKRANLLEPKDASPQRWISLTFRITAVSDFANYPLLRKLDLFPSLVQGLGDTYSVWSVRKNYPQSSIPECHTPSSETFRIQFNIVTFS
jgi:hypothetical protein